MMPSSVHFIVEDLDACICFYSTLFASMPTVITAAHARWSLDDPQVNFTISRRSTTAAPTRREHFSFPVVE